MDVPNNIAFQPPVLWELDKDNKSKDPAQMINAITILRDNPQWANEHLTETEQIISLLKQTDHLTEDALVIQDKLIEKFPDFFSMITVNMGGVQKQIPKERLISHSEKFKVEFSSGFKESNATEINLDSKDIANQNAFETFLTYLAGGDAILTEDNAFDLMLLAQEHGLQALVRDCAIFIGKNLDAETIKDILQTAFYYDLKDLKWQCIIFASLVENREVIKRLLKDKEISEKEKMILQYSLDWSSYGYKPTISEEGKKSIIFSPSLPMAVEKLKVIHEECGIEEINSLNYRDDLEKISHFIPNLYSLKIENFNLAKLPEIWRQNLKLIYGKMVYYRLDRFDAPEAEKIEFINRDGLTFIPRGKDCMKILNVPKAKSIKCNSCRQLNTVIAPQAEEASFLGCSELINFDFTYIKNLEMEQGLRILDLNAVNAERISCKWGRLQSLHAPIAKYIECNNTDLKNLDAPKAQMVKCNNCLDIEIVNGPEIKEINCGNCPNLRSLIVAEGCIIYGKKDLPKDCKITYIPNGEGNGCSK